METAKPTPDPVVKTAEKTRIVEEDKVVSENQSTDLIKDEEPGPASSSVSIQEEIAAPEEEKIAGKKISPVKPEEPISSNSAQDKEHFEESIDKLLNNDQTEWIYTDIDDKLTAQISNNAMSFIATPLMLLLFCAFIPQLAGEIKIGLVTILSMVFALGLHTFSTKKRWLKYASYVHQSSEPIEVYVYAVVGDFNSEQPRKYIKIYDEDNMYPSLSKVGKIEPKFGFLKSVGISYEMPETMVPVKIRANSLGHINALTIEANNNTVWCTFIEK